MNLLKINSKIINILPKNMEKEFLPLLKDIPNLDEDDQRNFMDEYLSDMISLMGKQADEMDMDEVDWADIRYIRDDISALRKIRAELQA